MCVYKILKIIFKNNNSAYFVELFAEAFAEESLAPVVVLTVSYRIMDGPGIFQFHLC